MQLPLKLVTETVRFTIIYTATSCNMWFITTAVLWYSYCIS